MEKENERYEINNQIMKGITVSRGHVDFFSLAERCIFTAEFFVALKVRLRGALAEVQIIGLY
jgi:hypothetical protein